LRDQRKDCVGTSIEAGKQQGIGDALKHKGVCVTDFSALHMFISPAGDSCGGRVYKRTAGAHGK
jgi:hypothetical protein